MALATLQLTIVCVWVEGMTRYIPLLSSSRESHPLATDGCHVSLQWVIEKLLSRRWRQWGARGSFKFKFKVGTAAECRAGPGPESCSSCSS